MVYSGGEAGSILASPLTAQQRNALEAGMQAATDDGSVKHVRLVFTKAVWSPGKVITWGKPFSEWASKKLSPIRLADNLKASYLRLGVGLAHKAVLSKDKYLSGQARVFAAQSDASKTAAAFLYGDDVFSREETLWPNQRDSFVRDTLPKAGVIVDHVEAVSVSKRCLTANLALFIGEDGAAALTQSLRSGESVILDIAMPLDPDVEDAIEKTIAAQALEESLRQTAAKTDLSYERYLDVNGIPAPQASQGISGYWPKIVSSIQENSAPLSAQDGYTVTIHTLAPFGRPAPRVFS